MQIIESIELYPSIYNTPWLVGEFFKNNKITLQKKEEVPWWRQSELHGKKWDYARLPWQTRLTTVGEANLNLVAHHRPARDPEQFWRGTLIGWTSHCDVILSYLSSNSNQNSRARSRVLGTTMIASTGFQGTRQSKVRSQGARQARLTPDKTTLRPAADDGGG